jgi:dihydroneopterin aldolase
MDTIIIRDLEVRYRIGVPAAEREHPQRLLISLEMTRDFRPAAAADDLSLTIDYHAVALRLRDWGKGRSWRLLETLATEIADLARGEFGAQSVTVVIKKFVLPDARYVAVKLQRPGNASAA